MYLYELPTTGAISFAHFCVDHSADKAYTRHISDATQARSNLRDVLKESKRTYHGVKDFLTLVKLIEEYLPALRGVMNCVAHDEINMKNEPTFSWRTTLSANLFNSSPRLDLPGLHADYSFTLLTYGFALSNLAYSIVTSVGNYEQDRAITDAGRQTKEKTLNAARDFLIRASGIFTFISDRVLPEWETNRVSPPNFNRPPDLSREVNSALASMALADAQTLAIRVYLSKSTYDSNVTPGPPLPASHRPPLMLAGLHIQCADLYSSARTLAKTPGATKTSSGDAKEVCAGLRRYLSKQADLHTALSHKWLGVHAGEKGGTEKGGEAVAFMQWAKKELEELKEGVKIVSLSAAEKDKEERWKEKINEELSSVSLFLKYYKKMNDTLHFQPVPTQSDLQSRIPGGRIVESAKQYTPATPSFGPGSVEYARRKAEQLEISGASADVNLLDPELEAIPSEPVGNYAGAGAYF